MLVSIRHPVVTVAGLLVFGRPEHIRGILPQHEVVYLRTPSGTTTFDRRFVESAPLLAIIERLQTEIQAGSRVRTLRKGARDLELPDYPEQAMREAIVNAFAHRHVSLPGPIVIRQTNNFVEIENTYTADRTMVRLRLDASAFDEPFARFILTRELEGSQFTVEELLLLSLLRRFGPVSRADLARAIQRSVEEAQDILNDALGRQLIDRWARVTASDPASVRRSRPNSARAAAYTRERGLAREYQRSIVMQHAREFGRIDNRTVRELLSIPVMEATQILKRLGERGELLQVGSRRWAYWAPAPEQLELGTGTQLDHSI